MKKLVGSALLVGLSLCAPRAAHAGDETFNGLFEAWLSVGDTLAKQDMGYGVVNRNGYGGGLGMRFGLPVIPVGKVAIGPWGGGETMGGPVSSSYDTGSIYFTYRVEAGLQVMAPLGRNYRLMLRGGYNWLQDTAMYEGSTHDGYSGWLARARVDHDVYAVELGVGGGDYRSQQVTLRWRSSGAVCPGVMFEHTDNASTQTSGVHARFFYSIDF